MSEWVEDVRNTWSERIVSGCPLVCEIGGRSGLALAVAVAGMFSVWRACAGLVDLEKKPPVP